jgi:hypothetical protein
MRWRLFLTVWMVYALHATTNVVRETYLAVTLAEHGTVRVDEYLGLHPDLFEIPGRGAYINNNPGAALVGAIPWLVARPVTSMLFRLRPGLIAPKPAASYDDPRPNRTRFMNEARARGVDVKLGLAALVTQVGAMAPLGALAALAIFGWFQARGLSERQSLWLTLLFAFGTPTFFRAAFLNQNALLAHYTLFAFLLMSRIEAPATDTVEDAAAALEHAGASRAIMGAGALLGLGLLTDYSAAPLLLVFGVWVLAIGARRGGFNGALRDGIRFTAGASIFIAVLFAYQWAAFGSPWFPAQRYMPATSLSVEGWYGFVRPTARLLFDNLFDPAFGLFAFSPLLLVALAEPFMPGTAGGPRREHRVVIWFAVGALWLFSSSIQYASLQWNTGVRYMVPAVPLLYLLAAPALLRLPALLRWGVIVPTVAISWSVSMTREAVPRALLQVFTGGFELPILTVLQKMASGYAPWLSGGASPLPIFVLASVVLWLIWRGEVRTHSSARRAHT